VVLVVGVNGSGKTTTIAKLASKWRGEGKRVVLGAGDTFRAAAVEQLRIWGERLDATVVAGKEGADAAGLAFDAIQTARGQNADILLMDTAGRLQNRVELMAELEKIVRVMKKADLEAPHAVLLVLDATVGQNALTQVDVFGKTAGVTGLVMTKLDGTARGGILVAIAENTGCPSTSSELAKAPTISNHSPRATSLAPSRGWTPRSPIPRKTRWRQRYDAGQRAERRKQEYKRRQTRPRKTKRVNTGLKLVLEFGPLALFFVANQNSGFTPRPGR